MTLKTFTKKISRRLSRLGRNYVLIAVYFVVLPIIGLAGSKFVIKKGGARSMWVPKSDSQNELLVSEVKENHWLSEYLRFAIRSKNFWAVFLLPFIVTIGMLEYSADEPPPEASLIYTLY